MTTAVYLAWIHGFRCITRKLIWAGTNSISTYRKWFSLLLHDKLLHLFQRSPRNDKEEIHIPSLIIFSCRRLAICCLRFLFPTDKARWYWNKEATLAAKFVPTVYTKAKLSAIFTRKIHRERSKARKRTTSYLKYVNSSLKLNNMLKFSNPRPLAWVSANKTFISSQMQQYAGGKFRKGNSQDDAIT